MPDDIHGFSAGDHARVSDVTLRAESGEFDRSGPPVDIPPSTINKGIFNRVLLTEKLNSFKTAKGWLTKFNKEKRAKGGIRAGLVPLIQNITPTTLIPSGIQPAATRFLITNDGTAIAGTFTVTLSLARNGNFSTSDTSGPIDFDATPTEVELALRELSNTSLDSDEGTTGFAYLHPVTGVGLEFGGVVVRLENRFSGTVNFIPDNDTDVADSLVTVDDSDITYLKGIWEATDREVEVRDCLGLGKISTGSISLWDYWSSSFWEDTGRLIDFSLDEVDNPWGAFGFVPPWAVELGIDADTPVLTTTIGGQDCVVAVGWPFQPQVSFMYPYFAFNLT